MLQEKKVLRELKLLLGMVQQGSVQLLLLAVIV